MKKKSKNASSFFQLNEIENGLVINKIKLPANSFEKFSLAKTDLFNTKLDDVFIIRPQAGKLLDLKLGKK